MKSIHFCGTIVFDSIREAERHLHKLIELLLIIVTGVLFVVFVKYMPGGKPLSRKRAALLFVVGAIIGVLFVTTQNLYVQNTTL